MTKKILLFLLLLLEFNSCAVFNPIPQPKREFRGFWVATVVNIDWPKNGNDAVKKQMTDYLQILRFYKNLNFNAAIVQVRTAGDAFYNSEYAPWSRFLTGEEGVAPNLPIRGKETEKNLLSWMIDVTHQHGMEFHAWVNPYRATFDLNTEILSPTHDFNLHPEWMLKYGKKYYYDPGLPEVRKRMVSVIDEIVSEYDIDAIHFDDYFYPYRIQNEVLKDSLTYEYHALPEQTFEDWRRSNIDSLVKNTHETIKARKPWVQFGISPFGVWKNKSSDAKGSDTQAGQTTYEDLYADPLLWMQEGWLDYLVPQVYWSMELPVASHRKIVDWWAQNSTNTNLYIGNGAYKIRNNSDKAWERKRELPDQLTLARKTDAVQGNVFFSAKSLMKNNIDVVKLLRRKYYKHEALPPSSPYILNNSNFEVSFKSILKKDSHSILKFNDLKDYRFIIIYSSGKRKEPDYPIKKLLVKAPVTKDNPVSIPSKKISGNRFIAITFIDGYGRESEPIVVDLKREQVNP